MARDLATLGHRRFRQGYPLNVRRREEVRRSLAEAAEELAWDEVVALSDDPVAVVAKDVKKILRSGVRSLEKSLEEELEQKKKETRRLEKVITQVEALAEDPEAFPAEIEYVHTARKVDSGFPTKVETLTLTDPEEALKAAKKIRKSLPRWDKFRKEAVDELKQRQATLGEMGKDLSDVIDGWRSLLKELVLVIA